MNASIVDRLVHVVSNRSRRAALSTALGKVTIAAGWLVTLSASRAKR